MINHKMTPKQVITLLGAGTAISLLGDSTMFTVLPNPDISAQVGVTLTMVGLLLGANRAIRLFINSPVGILYEKMPRRPLLIMSLVIASISNVIYAVGFGFWPLLIGRLFWGISWSLLWIGSKTVILEISGEDNRGQFNGLYQMLFFIGVGMCSLSGGILTDQFGFRATQLIGAAVVLAMAVIWYFFLPETRVKDKHHKKRKRRKSKNDSIPLEILIPGALTILVARFIGWGVLSATSALWISSLFGSGIHLFGLFIPIVTLTGIYSAVKMIPGITSGPAVGFISDKLRNRWILIIASLLIGGAGIWLMGAENSAVALFGAFLSPIIGGSVETLVPAVIGDSTEKEIHGRMLGIIYTFGDLGAMLGPMAALGVLDSSLASLKGLYRGCVFLLIFAAVVAAWQIFKGNESE